MNQSRKRLRRDQVGEEKLSKSDVICPVCFDIFTSVQVTVCGHSFCHECIHKSVAQTQQCPICGTKLSRDSGFTPNFSLNDIVAKIRSQETHHNASLSYDAYYGNVLQMEENEVEDSVFNEFLIESKKAKEMELQRVTTELSTLSEDIQVLSRTHAPLSEEGKRCVIQRKQQMYSNIDDLQQAYFKFTANSHISSSGLNTDSLVPSSSSVSSGSSSSSSFVPPETSLDSLPSINGQGTDSTVMRSEGSTAFRETLSAVTQYSSFKELATLTYADGPIGSCSTVSSIEFDKDGDFFAVGGVTKKVKIFDYNTVTEARMFPTIHYPVREIPCHAKISSVAYSPYIKPQLATSDYDGTLSIWDCHQMKCTRNYQEHEKRVWSVCYNQYDTSLLATGGDDCCLKLWRLDVGQSVQCVPNVANVCSVRFQPKNKYTLAYGSAGGEIALSLKGIMRVVWKRERVGSNGKKMIDRLPFLCVTRSLGDFWSYSAESGEYTVSPVLYVYDFPLDLNVHKFIVLASDGLWNVMSPLEVVNFISDFDSKGSSGNSSSSDTNVQRDVVSALIKEALSRYGHWKLQADNIAVLIVYLSKEEETGAPTVFDVVSSSNEATEVDSKSAISCLEEADSRQCATIPSIPSPRESSLSPSPSLIERKISVKSCSGENESFMRLLPNGSSVEYESMIKYRHKRKKTRKVSKYKTLLPTISDPSMSDIHVALPSPPNSNSHSSPVESSIDPSTTGIMGIMDEEYTGHLHKRSKDDGVDDEDERVSLQKFKEELPLPIDFSPLRCNRVSTDNSSDSGSSDIVSDMDSASNTEILLSLLTPPSLADSPLLCTTPKLINSSSLPDDNTLNAK